ncbi:CMD domain-containing protein [Variovorax sp. PBL-E5]|uniref:CMD domain-containing protein n=1 Tax=Variovorax sp. PBL-E5 TaxID=434014 RepID=UPI0013195FB4|nr:CMD domain protein [Variovorax sp. PBL-E5]VTU20448.1 CMD domain protein, family [Variovorax sp. PBL-E5]
MTSATSSSPAVDLIDAIVPLAAGQPTWDVRQQRPKVIAATQGSLEAMFSPTVEGLSVIERLLVAWHACRVAKADSLAGHYRERLVAEGAEPQVLDAVERGALSSLADPRLGTMLGFAGRLMQRPIEGDRAALQSLAACGLTTPAIVALGQLIAFLSYQVRLAAGLQAMAAAEVAP